MDKHAFMRACREGGDSIEDALRALDRSLFAVLYRECLRSVRDSEAARDIVQETFIKVWQRCASFRGDAELLPWIRSILRHRILDRWRKPEREVQMADEDGIPDGIARHMAAVSRGSLTLPDDELRRRQLGECFERCWKRFEAAAPSHAAVMTWIVEDGLTNAEISQLLERTPGATREFISQCRKRARLYLAEWYELVTMSGDPA